jgi:hypothetical protein
MGFSPALGLHLRKSDNVGRPAAAGFRAAGLRLRRWAWLDLSNPAFHELVTVFRAVGDATGRQGNVANVALPAQFAQEAG